MIIYYENERKKFEKAIGLREHVCSECGKTFECTSAYVYKRFRNKRTHGAYDYYCSYKCFRAEELKKNDMGTVRR